MTLVGRTSRFSASMSVGVLEVVTLGKRIIMASADIKELRSFDAFLTRTFAKHGSVPTSPEECLDFWLLEQTTSDERAATFEAIREGFADVEARRVRPFEEFEREFQKRHGLLSRT